MHHIYPKDILSLRWDPGNCVILCFSPCHNNGSVSEPSAHDNLKVFRQEMKEKRGPEWHERISVRARINRSIGEIDLAEERRKLEELLRKERAERDPLNP